MLLFLELWSRKPKTKQRKTESSLRKGNFSIKPPPSSGGKGRGKTKTGFNSKSLKFEPGIYNCAYVYTLHVLVVYIILPQFCIINYTLVGINNGHYTCISHVYLFLQWVLQRKGLGLHPTGDRVLLLLKVSLAPSSPPPSHPLSPHRPHPLPR